MEKRTTLKRSIMARCILFIFVLCLVLSVMNYFSFRYALYQRYEEYIRELLTYAASNIDVEDMKECVETGVKSEKYNETQKLFDNIKDTHEIVDFIYVIDPINTEPVDNVMNIIAGMSSYEKEFVPENEVTLGGLTGDDYSVESVTKYYNARDKKDKITFFEEYLDRWGSDYTGILSLYDDNGKYFAELCVDVAMKDIHKEIRAHVAANVAVIILIGILFTVLFLIWTRRAITDPIQVIEEKVVDLANRSHGQTDPDVLVIDMPEIKTKNELQSLSGAIVKLSEDMRDYLLNALSARNDAETAQQKAMEMSEQAIKDSLTGIRNRHAYEDEVKKLEWRIKSDGFTKFGIAMVDLNFLKRINDTFGHEMGNLSIKKICMIICKTFSHSPVFRIGGDEFVVILENDDYDKVDERMDDFHRVLKEIGEDQSLEPWEKVSAAIGWTMFDPEVDHTVDNVFKRADQKMYENKKAMKAERPD